MLAVLLLVAQSINYYPSSGSPSATVTVAASNSVRSGGAQYVCDGTSDEVEIQAAINALPTAGGVVQLLEGTYDIRNPITMRSNMWLRGQGPGTILKMNKAAWNVASNRYIFYDGPGHSQATQSNITFSDLMIDCDDYTGSGASEYVTPIIFWGFNAIAENNRVDRCVIKDGYGYAVLTIRNTGFHASGNTISNWGDSCIEIRSTRGAVVSDNDFASCSIQTYADELTVKSGGIIYSGNNFTNVGFYVANPGTGKQVQGLLIANNVFRTVGNISINTLIHAVKGLVIDNNVWDTTLQTHATPNAALNIAGDTVTDARIAGNTFDVGTVSGSGAVCIGALDIDGGADVLVSGNTIRCPTSASGTAILAQSVDRLTVESNTIDTWATGISIAATAAGSRVMDNRFSGTVTAPYSLLDTSTLFRDQAGLAFASLPADAADGSLVYCSDCEIASPCAGSSTGALAKRLNNTWVCN